MADTRGPEVDELRLGRLSREIVPEEPLITAAILFPEEGVDLRPCGAAGEDDPIVHIHTEGGLRGCAKAGEEGGGIKGGQDRG